MIAIIIAVDNKKVVLKDNAVFAPNILASDSQKEFIQELEYQRLIHSYAQFENGVINSSSRLLGSAGTYLQL